MSDVLRVIPRAGAFDIGNARITVFPTSHDATESIDFRVDHDGASIGILTDTGVVTPEAEQTLAGVDLMVLESNHDEEWLLSGPYPYYLKQRILGRGATCPTPQPARLPGGWQNVGRGSSCWPI